VRADGRTRLTEQLRARSARSARRGRHGRRCVAAGDGGAVARRRARGAIV